MRIKKNIFKVDDNQLDFFSDVASKPVKQAVQKRAENRKPIVAVLPKRKTAVKLAVIPLFVSQFNQNVINHIKDTDRTTGTHLIIAGPSGLGKTHIGKSLSTINKELKSQYITAFNWQSISALVKSNFSLDTYVFDDFEKVQLDAEKSLELTCLLNLINDAGKKIIFLVSTANKLKRILGDSIWSQTIISELQQLSLDEKMDFTAYFNKSKKVKIQFSKYEPIIQYAKNLKSLNHFCLNLLSTPKELFNLTHIEKIAKLCFGRLDEDNQKFEKIVKEICVEYNINPEDISSKSRKQDIVLRKHFVYYKLSKQYTFSYFKIANYFGLNHTSVMYAVNKVTRTPDLYLNRL